MRGGSVIEFLVLQGLALPLSDSSELTAVLMVSGYSGNSIPNSLHLM